jgi:hypothetical protein
MELDSRLEEIRLKEERRRPMTPAEMVRFYGGAEVRSPSRTERIWATLIKTLTTLSQRLKSKNPTQTVRPACRGNQLCPRH